jgi:hypothetical protein
MYFLISITFRLALLGVGKEPSQRTVEGVLKDHAIDAK